MVKKIDHGLYSPPLLVLKQQPFLTFNINYAHLFILKFINKKNKKKITVITFPMVASLFPYDKTKNTIPVIILRCWENI